MYRAFVFMQMPGSTQEDSLRFTSQSLPTYQYAVKVLDDLAGLVSPNVIVRGGDIERNVPGIGWTLCDHEAEINADLGDTSFM